MGELAPSDSLAPRGLRGGRFGRLHLRLQLSLQLGDDSLVDGFVTRERARSSHRPLAYRLGRAPPRLVELVRQRLGLAVELLPGFPQLPRESRVGFIRLGGVLFRRHHSLHRRRLGLLQLLRQVRQRARAAVLSLPELRPEPALVVRRGHQRNLRVFRAFLERIELGSQPLDGSLGGGSQLPHVLRVRSLGLRELRVQIRGGRRHRLGVRARQVQTHASFGE